MDNYYNKLTSDKNYSDTDSDEPALDNQGNQTPESQTTDIEKADKHEIQTSKSAEYELFESVSRYLPESVRPGLEQDIERV